MFTLKTFVQKYWKALLLMVVLTVVAWLTASQTTLFRGSITTSIGGTDVAYDVYFVTKDSYGYWNPMGTSLFPNDPTGNMFSAVSEQAGIKIVVNGIPNETGTGALDLAASGIFAPPTFEYGLSEGVTVYSDVLIGASGTTTTYNFPPGVITIDGSSADLIIPGFSVTFVAGTTAVVSSNVTTNTNDVITEISDLRVVAYDSNDALVFDCINPMYVIFPVAGSYNVEFHFPVGTFFNTAPTFYPNPGAPNDVPQPLAPTSGTTPTAGGIINIPPQGGGFNAGDIGGAASENGGVGIGAGVGAGGGIGDAAGGCGDGDGGGGVGFPPSGITWCGDTVVQPPEQCETPGTDLTSQMILMVGWGARCDNQCRIQLVPPVEWTSSQITSFMQTQSSTCSSEICVVEVSDNRLVGSATVQEIWLNDFTIPHLVTTNRGSITQKAATNGDIYYELTKPFDQAVSPFATRPFDSNATIITVDGNQTFELGEAHFYDVTFDKVGSLNLAELVNGNDLSMLVKFLISNNVLTKVQAIAVFVGAL